MKNYINKPLNPLIFCISILFLYGCITPKDTAVSRKMQNLTARYNYIYNSNVLLTEYNDVVAQSYLDDYEKPLPVYFDPEPQRELIITSGLENKQLDEIISKGQTIINDKSFSNYIDDAYMLLGKANYLKGNYFTASEYFDYVAKTYKSNIKIFIMAMNWKARSQMQLNHLAFADKVLDTMLNAVDNYGKDLPEPLATTAQMRIYQNRNPEAILLLQTAIRTAVDKQLRIRWQYILAQLQEKENDPQNAFINYNKVENSNAPFEMYFHANLRRTKLKALISGNKVNEDKELLSLIKDDKNFDYIDQIYYQVGELFFTESDYKKAEENYINSVKTNTKNQNQKALSYLKIADLNFKYFGNYVKAKAYYDSTITVLPKIHPDYGVILKKANNLQYLTDRYAIISSEDTLQMIAKLPESQREAKIKSLLNKPLITKPISTINNGVLPSNAAFINQSNNLNVLPVGNGSTFYFNNTAAVSNGFADFRKRWGNRQLEDNWRQSQRSAAEESNQILNGGIIAALENPVTNQDTQVLTDSSALQKEYLAKLPINPDLLQRSNQTIIDAYFEIAGFYQQELNDKNEANKIYIELLNRFPENNQLAAIYYSLYLNYQAVDQLKATEYKQLVLNKFPNSNFAKTILDPAYSVKQNKVEDAVNENYNEFFNVYASKDYTQVIKQSIASLTSFPNNELAPQYAYLKAIAVGRTSKLEPLLSEFNSIVAQYPEDKIITPLVKDHLRYIEANLTEFKARKFALIDFDNNAPRFVSQPKAASKQPLITHPTDSTKIAPKPIDKSMITETAGIKSDGLFNNGTSTTYYYVIDVSDASLTLTSSRFGLGQFNRGNYPDNELVHKIVEFDNDQLIYVDSFIDLEDAKLYESSIANQLSKIMKVPVNNYRTFIISKENFEKLTTRELIDQYLRFFKIGY